MPLGALEDTETRYVSHALLSGYSDHFIKISYLKIIFPLFLPTAALKLKLHSKMTNLFAEIPKHKNNTGS